MTLRDQPERVGCLGVWFDTAFRKTSGRLTTNGGCPPGVARKARSLGVPRDDIEGLAGHLWSGRGVLLGEGGGFDGHGGEAVGDGFGEGGEGGEGEVVGEFEGGFGEVLDVELGGGEEVAGVGEVGEGGQFDAEGGADGNFRACRRSTPARRGRGTCRGS